MRPFSCTVHCALGASSASVPFSCTVHCVHRLPRCPSAALCIVQCTLCASSASVPICVRKLPRLARPDPSLIYICNQCYSIILLIIKPWMDFMLIKSRPVAWRARGGEGGGGGKVNVSLMLKLLHCAFVPLGTIHSECSLAHGFLVYSVLWPPAE